MTTDTTQGGIDLDAIEAREQAARPGPWTMRDDLDGQGYPGHLWIVENDEDKVDEEFGVAISIGTEDDAEFIAHSREDIPALVAEVRRLNKVVALLGNHLQGGAEDVKAVARSAEAEIERLRADLADAERVRDRFQAALGEAGIDCCPYCGHSYGGRATSEEIERHLAEPHKGDEVPAHG